MKIAHISDLHICDNGSDDSLEKVYLLLKTLARQKFDHIIITGDITENGTQSEYELARELLDLFDFLDSEKATVIIGNHDVYGGMQRLEDLIHFPAPFLGTDYETKVAAFHSVFGSLLANTHKPPNAVYPFVKKIESVHLLGLNSVKPYSRFFNPFGAKGSVSDEQMQLAPRLLEDVNDRDILLVAVHHHFNHQPVSGNTLLECLWRTVENHSIKLKGRRKLLNALMEYNLGAVLHGHTHHNEAYRTSGIQFYNAGASVMNNTGATHYNILTVEGNTVQYTQKVHIPLPSGSISAFWPNGKVGLVS